MSNLQTFHNLGQLQHKFNEFFKHRAKLRALMNYDEAVDYKNHRWITLIQECMKDGFLQDKESEFLDHILSKCEINFLDWNCRTKWVKRQIKKIRLQNTNPTPKNLDLFSWKNPAHEVYVPLNLLNQERSNRMEAR